MNLAAQLLSEHTARAAEAYLPNRTSEATAILTIDRWFDIFNSRSPFDVKEERRGFGITPEVEGRQMRVLDDMEQMVQQARKVDPQGRERRTKLPCQQGIIRNIYSLRGLLTDVRAQGLRYVLTARLNQDLVENLFSRLRAIGGANTHPCAAEAEMRLRQLLIAPQPVLASQSKSWPVQPASSSFEAAASSSVLNDGAYESNFATSDLPEVTLPDPEQQAHDEEDSATEKAYSTVQKTSLLCVLRAGPDTAQLERPSEEALAFVAGYVAAVCRDLDSSLGKHSSICPTAELAKVPSEWIGKLSRGNLTIPSPEWYHSVIEMEDVFQEEMGPRYSPRQGLKKHLNKTLQIKKPHINPRVIAKYTSTRIWMRVKRLNETKKSVDAQRRALRKLKQHML